MRNLLLWFCSIITEYWVRLLCYYIAQEVI